MKYFYDTEFIEDGKTIDLISIGVVCEDGREFYAESRDVDISKANQWIKDNVLPHLWVSSPDNEIAASWLKSGGEGGFLFRDKIATKLQSFCDIEKYGKPEFWAYYADYDHVALCQLFGTMMNLPKGWPMYTRDIKQLADFLSVATLPEQVGNEHHALADARWNMIVYNYLLEQLTKLLN